MEEWRDAGVVIAARRHGEGRLIVSLFTASHGRQRGMLRLKRGSPVGEPGTVVSATWKARLEDHLGTLTAEVLEVGAASLFDDPLRLAGLSSLCALLEAVLPEREAHPDLYGATLDVLAQLQRGESWLAAYARWELQLLADLGYGLDLSECAVSGTRDDLAYVSPKSGRAVARRAAGAWVERLLPLPDFLREDTAETVPLDHIKMGLSLTGHFLEARLLLNPQPARQRLIQRLSSC